MSGAPLTLSELRRYAIGRSLFAPTTLAHAIERLGFVQADPIRAPARAQDLILRQRVKDYRAGDLERLYATLEIEEDFFINYGFVPRSTYQLMHPRSVAASQVKLNARRARALLEFVAQRAFVHPREVDAHFAHGRVTNYWGGSSNATTRLLDALHYRGQLRVVGRERGVRLYALHARGAPAVATPEKRTARAIAAARTAPHASARAQGRDESPNTERAALDASARGRGHGENANSEARAARDASARTQGGGENAKTERTARGAVARPAQEEALPASLEAGALVARPRKARLDAAERAARLDALVDVVVGQYAPLTASGLANVIGRLRHAAPQWARERGPALARAKARLGQGEHAGLRWYWPADERPRVQRVAHFERVRLLAPFDPVVWDRRRFELLWGWAYRFEAYTPSPKRKLGYYALPLLWREDVIGWANLTWKSDQLDCQLGFQRARPRDPTFERELEAELTRTRAFLR